MTSRSTGTALIVAAAFCGQVLCADTSLVSVVEVDEVRAGYPNLPNGMEVISASDGSVAEGEDGSALGMSMFGSWFEFSTDPDVELVDDRSNPTGSGSAVRVNIGANGSGAIATANSFPGGPYREVYVMYRVFLEDGAGWDEGGNKWFYIGHEGSPPNRHFIDRPWAGLPGTFRALVNAVVRPGEDRVMIDSSRNPPMGTQNHPHISGEWLNIETLWIAESAPGAGDGKVFAWVNGVSMGESHDAFWTRDDEAHLWDKFQLYGHFSGTRSHGLSFRIGELYLAGRR